MKKIFFMVTLFLFFINLPAFPGSRQQRFKEEVTVTAVEVPVRVFYQGKPLTELTRADFEIYENGIKQEITGFEAVSRKIAGPRTEEKDSPQERLFMLIFNVYDYNPSVEEGIDHFFQNYFRPGNNLLILTENTVLNIGKGENLSETVLRLKETLKKYKAISSMHIQQAFKELGFEADRLLSILRGEQTGITSQYQAVYRFFNNYRRIWLDYRRQYLVPDLALYRSLIKRIKPMPGEKWALCFQQREMFPRLKNEGTLDAEIRNWIGQQTESEGQAKARFIQSQQFDLHKNFSVSENFPAENLRDLFMEANITFHLILLRSFRSLLSPDFALEEVSQDYEDCFRRLSRLTGGSSSFSQKVWPALAEAAHKRDFYYLLWYTPADDSSDQKKNIEVKVKRKGVKVIYSKRFPEKEPPPVTITQVKAGHKRLSFTLLNYQRIKSRGTVEVNITLFDENSKKAFSEGKIMSLTKEKAHISLNLNRVKSGTYFLILEAADKISEETDVFSREIEL
ncbi:MAG: hypothetical protein ACLFVG_03340 [Candidatus Aminicenantes bacterium]